MARSGRTITTIQLNPADHLIIDALKQRHGFRTTAEVVRHGLRMARLFDSGRITLEIPRPGAAEESRP